MVLYHVTYVARLEGIARRGLRPAPSHRVGWQREHSKGYVFLTEADGVGFWYHNLQHWAEHHSDNPFEDELTPVVLRVRWVDEEDLVLDREGTKDAGHAEAYMVAGPVAAPADIEVWNGSAWVELGEDIDASQAWEVEELDDEEPILWAKFDSPLAEPDFDAPWYDAEEE